MSIPSTPNLPSDANERNLLIDPVNGHYRLTKQGTDVRTADPDLVPEEFEFHDDSLAADIVLATGSFVPNQQQGQTDALPQIDHSETDQIILYYSVNGRYYFRPAVKGGWNNATSYSTYEQGTVYGGNTANKRFELEQAFVFATGTRGNWSVDSGFYQLPWQAHPLVWVQIDMSPETALPNPVAGQRFKVRSAAEGGGFMLSKIGRNITSTDPDDFVIHPDKRTLQFIARFDISVPSGGNVFLPLPAGTGTPVPVIFVAGVSSYFVPYMRLGFAISQAQFEYVSGGVQFYNSGGSAGDLFTVFFLNVQMP